MAVAWARGESLTSEKSLEEILAIADYEEKKYGNYYDKDAEDTDYPTGYKETVIPGKTAMIIVSR